MQGLRSMGVAALTVLVFAVGVAGCGKSDAHGGHEEHGGHEGHGGQEEHGHEGHQEGVVQLTPEAARHAKLRVAAAVRRKVPPQLRTTARVDYDERRLAHVAPRIAGRVAEVESELGDQVEPGTVLARLDSVELGQAKARYLIARAQESVARKTLRREESLFEDRITSKQSVLEARGKHREALAQLRAAKETLRLLGLDEDAIRAVKYGDPKASVFPLVAPIAGRVVDKHVVKGELVTPGDKVFTIADLGRLWVWIDVYEGDLAKVHVDDRVRVVTRSYPERPFEGRVAYMSDHVDPVTRASRARIDIANDEGLLKPGMFAEVVVADPHSAPREVVAVPPSAVVRDGGRRVVFVKTGERRYERRVVELGTRTDEYAEVASGLDAGDEVVVEGAFLVKSEAAKESMGGGHSH